MSANSWRWNPPPLPSPIWSKAVTWSCSKLLARAGWSGLAKRCAGVKNVEVMIQTGARYVNDLLSQPIFDEIGGRYCVGRSALVPAVVSLHFIAKRRGGGDRAAAELVAGTKGHRLAAPPEIRPGLSGQSGRSWRSDRARGLQKRNPNHGRHSDRDGHGPDRAALGPMEHFGAAHALVGGGLDG